MRILHKQGNKVVMDDVYRIEFSQDDQGNILIEAETGGQEEPVTQATIVAFMSDEDAAAQAHAAVNPRHSLTLLVGSFGVTDADVAELDAQGPSDELIKRLRELESKFQGILH